MTSANRTGRLRWLGLALSLAVVPGLLWAADRAGKAPAADQAKPVAETVEMFAAIEAEQIEVKLIPKDSTECRVFIKNKTDKPLSIKLPEAFAGVPVLAQFGGGGMGGMGGGGMGGMGGMGGQQGMGGGMGGMGMGGMGGGGMGGMGGGGNQGMGGGMGGMGGGGMGGGGMGGMGGGGGGFFNVPPEKVGDFKVTTVCLEHGKREPRPKMKYEIKPIEELTDKPEVREVCRMLGYGMLPQRAAQVAAWHLNSNMSWQQLAGKQLHYADGTRSPYFSQQEIRGGMQVVAAAAKLAKEREESGKQGSLSQK